MLRIKTGPKYEQQLPLKPNSKLNREQLPQETLFRIKTALQVSPFPNISQTPCCELTRVTQ